MAVKKKIARLERRLGRRDLDVGDSEFDEVFHVDGDDEEWVRRHLDEDLRRMHLRHPAVSLRLRDGKLTASRSGVLDDADELRALLEVAVTHARALG